MARIREVRKRDNRVVPFDQTKIADAIYKAVCSVGKGDRYLADDLAAAVTMFLERKYVDAIPGIEDIQDMVETVLIETGHAEIAKAYILYRNKRARIREVLRVRKELPAEGMGSLKVEAGSQDEAEEWSKGRIVAALIREADIDADAAEGIASAVERKVFQSGIERISTGLVRELVDNELFERGFGQKLKRQAPIGLPKYNLEQIILSADDKEAFSYAKGPLEVRDIIAASILHQYALEELFSPEVSRAHREGRIHIHRLSDPLRFRTLRAPARLVPDREDFRRRWEAASKHLIVGDLTENIEPVADVLDDLAASCGFAGTARVWVELDLGLGEARAVEDALSWWERRSASGLSWLVIFSPETFRVPGGPDWLRRAADLYSGEEGVEFLPMRVPARDLVVGKVTLNLPQLGFRSAQDRTGDILLQIDSAVDLAVKAHLERRRYVERLGRGSRSPLWRLLGETRESPPCYRLEDAEHEIGILGMNECVKFLTGQEIFQGSAGVGLAREILLHMREKIEREARGLGLSLSLVETRNAGSLRRLEAIDRKRFPETREVFRGREELGYSDGVRLHRMAPVDPLSRNQYLARLYPGIVPAGLVEDVPDLRTIGGEVLVSLLEESIPHFEVLSVSPVR